MCTRMAHFLFLNVFLLFLFSSFYYLDLFFFYFYKGKCIYYIKLTWCSKMSKMKIGRFLQLCICIAEVNMIIMLQLFEFVICNRQPKRSRAALNNRCANYNRLLTRRSRCITLTLKKKSLWIYMYSLIKMQMAFTVTSIEIRTRLASRIFGQSSECENEYRKSCHI